MRPRAIPRDRDLTLSKNETYAKYRAAASFLIMLMFASSILQLIVLPTVRNVSASDGVHHRHVYVRNFEKRAFTNYPVYLTLAFPDNNVTNTELNCMRIVDSLGAEVPYQIEGNSTYANGFIKWAGVWLLVTIGPNETQEYTLILKESAPDYGMFGTISTAGNRISITTSSFSSVIFDYAKGMSWYELKDTSGSNLLKNPDTTNMNNSVFDIRDQKFNASTASQPDKRIRYNSGISTAATVSYVGGPLFVTVYWSVTDDYGDIDDGWIRIWKNQAWIEFWINGTAPVTSTYPQAYVGFRIDSTSSTGTSVNNGTLSYAKNSVGTLGITSVIYQNPTNFYGNVRGYYSEKYLVEAQAGGTVMLHYRFGYGSFSNYDASAINGRIGLPAAVILKPTGSTIETAIYDYMRRPIATYYDEREINWITEETLSLFRSFLETYKDKFVSDSSIFAAGVAKARATLILFDIDSEAQLSAFITSLKAFSVSSGNWNMQGGAQFAQYYSDWITSAYWIYKKTGNGQLRTEIERLLKQMYLYHTTVKPITEFLLPINMRKASIDMMYRIKELFPNSIEVSTLLAAMATQNTWLYNGTEAFNSFFFPKYQTYGQAWGTPVDRYMNTLLTSHYMVNIFDISDDYPTVDLDAWLRSYGVMQDSMWTRTKGEIRDDYMFEWAHTLQDRLSLSMSYPAYIRCFLELPTDENISGIATARLSLEYLKTLTNSTYFNPFAADSVLSYQNQTFNYAETLKTHSMQGGWNSDFGAFEAALMYYSRSVRERGEDDLPLKREFGMMQTVFACTVIGIIFAMMTKARSRVISMMKKYLRKMD